MNFTTFMGLVTGGLQFTVAGYALRLNRLFGTARVGWSLFWAFLLLAVLHLMPSVIPVGGSAELVVKVDVVYALISLLLLAGMVHLETILKERLRTAREEQRMRAELEWEVKRKTAHLTRALEELQAEMEERQRAQSAAATAHSELRAVSQQAEMALIADCVLHNLSQMLQSVNVSADLAASQVRQLQVANAVRLAAMIREHAADLAAFMTRDPEGRKLPATIAQLAEHLAADQSRLLNELESLKKHLEKIAAMQQNYARLCRESAPAPAPLSGGVVSVGQPIEAPGTA